MGMEWFLDLENVLPFTGMVMVILLQVSNMVVSKAALSQGMDKYVLIVYSGFLCDLIFLPFPFIFRRSASPRPHLTFRVLCGFILLTFLGCFGQICENAGMLYSTPTLATALLNLVPAFTFILAFAFRMEKLKWKSSSSIAKVGGTLVSIGGAFVVTLYKGPAILMMTSYSSSQSNWILGGFLFTTEALAVSAQFIVQALVLKMYPAVLFVMLYLLCFGTILSTAVSLIMVRDPKAWRLRLDMGLVAVVYAAVSALLRLALYLWILGRTGPLYVSMFNPLAIIFSGVMSVLFLGDALCLGSLIGSVTIVAGFYGVMWGKAKEKENGVASLLVSSTNKDPLLQNTTQDMQSPEQSSS